ncbi:MAG: Zn-dependent exopeptidase M28 [Desulfobacterales bacterium]|nr:Zn-dependent exopeptidase M28 [Desulfobacterales bacterium]
MNYLINRILKSKILTYLLLFLFIPVISVYAFNKDINISASRGTIAEKVEIKWDPVEKVTSYLIFKSFNYDGPYFPIGKTKPGNELFYDTCAEKGKYYWYKVVPKKIIILGERSRRVQGWVEFETLGGMISMVDRFSGILKQIPHFNNVKKLAEKRQPTLPDVDNYSYQIPDKDKIFGWIEDICENDHRRIGSPESKIAINKIKNMLTEILGNQATVIDETFPIDDVYEAKTWKLELDQGDGLKEYGSFYAVNTGMTLQKPFGGIIEGEMIWLADGSRTEFEKLGKDKINGKIIVAECKFPDLPLGAINALFGGGYYSSDPENFLNLLTTIPMGFARSNFPAEYDEEVFEDSVYNLAVTYGAQGIVLIMKNHPGDINTHWGPYDGKMRDLPCLWVSSYKEEEMKLIAKNSTMAKITIEGKVEPGVGHNLYARLPATEPNENKETILISSHHDSCFEGWTEDGTGVSMVLSQAAIWAKQQKREKDIVFVITDGHHYAGIGAKDFAEKHQDDIMSKTIININLEHLAAKDVKENADGSITAIGSGAPAFIFINESPTAIATVARMLDNSNPKLDKTLAIHSTLLGDVPPGEAGHFHIASGIDYIHWIGSPLYLLTAEDTEDKVDKSKLVPIAKSVADMVKTFMLLPQKYSDYE